MPKWIPCSERKPELWHKVIVTVKGTDYITCEDGESIAEAIERTRKVRRVDVGFVGSDGWYGADGYPMVVDPIAWMPLPEVYEGE